MKISYLFLVLLLLFASCAPVADKGETAETTDAISAKTEIPTATFPEDTTTRQEGVGFQSAAVEKAVREALGILEGALSDDDLARVETLSVYAKDAAIEEVLLCKNLRELELVAYVGGLDFLGGLQKLNTLIVLGEGNLFDETLDLTGVEDIKELETLAIGGYRPKNLECLQACASLKKLTLYHARLTDFAPFAQLTGLEELRFCGYPGGNSNVFTNVNGIENFSNLKTLAICVNGANLGVLAGLPELTALSIVGSTLPDYSFLCQMENLTDLTVTFSNIQQNDLAYVAALKKLKFAIIDGEFDYSSLLALEGLECWYFGNNIFSENFGNYQSALKG